LATRLSGRERERERERARERERNCDEIYDVPRRFIAEARRHSKRWRHKYNDKNPKSKALLMASARRRTRDSSLATGS
jgi:hypothetical protein